MALLTIYRCHHPFASWFMDTIPTPSKMPSSRELTVKAVEKRMSLCTAPLPGNMGEQNI